MVGNPFEEGLRAPPALALLADMRSRQIAALFLLWSDLPPAVRRGGGRHESQMQHWSMCVICLDNHRGQTDSARTAWTKELAPSLGSAGSQ